MKPQSDLKGKSPGAFIGKPEASSSSCDQHLPSKHSEKLQAILAESIQARELAQGQTVSDLSVPTTVQTLRLDLKLLQRRIRLERAAVLLYLGLQFGCLLWVKSVRPSSKPIEGTHKPMDWAEKWVQDESVLGSPQLPKAAVTESSCPIFQRPSKGQQTSEFGLRLHPITKRVKRHDGIDLAAGYGSPIQAAAAGTVIQVGDAGDGYGLKVILRHPQLESDRFETLYAHLSQSKITVGSQVRLGQVIGFEGQSGWSTGSHLHFEVRVNQEPQDPHRFMGKPLGGACQ